MNCCTHRNEVLPEQAEGQASPQRWLFEAVRWLVRIGCLAILTALLWPGVQLRPHWLRPAMPRWLERLESPESARLVPAFSPWIALSSLAATHTLSLAAGVGLGVGLLVLFRRRLFCRWLCPMGVCTELAGRAGRLCRLRAVRLAPVGQWIALLTLAGACLGYPLLLWMDPLALWAGWITTASVHRIASPQPPALPLEQQNQGPVQNEPAFEATQPAHKNWLAAGVAAVLGIGFLLPGLWCTRLCPLGGLQEILWQLRQVGRQLGQWALRGFPSAPAKPPAGDAAVEVIKRPPAQPAESAWTFGRRVVLAGLVGVVWAAWTKCLRAGLSVPKVLAGAWLGKEHPVPLDLPRPLRPPGAADEQVFSGLCIRCGNCIRLCPSRILFPQDARHGLAGFLTPVVRLDQDYCREDCVRCTQACPTGALRPLLPAEKPKVRIGLARVDMGRCMLGEARECFICRDRCPLQAIRTQFSPITYMMEVQIDPARCNGCGACQTSCPTWPRAIVVHPL